MLTFNYCKEYPEEFVRYIDHRYWRGFRFVESRDMCKRAAKCLRDNGYPARAVVLPETNNRGFVGGLVERYLLLMPEDIGAEEDTLLCILDGVDIVLN